MHSSSPKQLSLLSPELLWKQTLLHKIEGLIPYPVFDHLSKCGTEEIYQTCRECRNWKTFYYRCSLKFCPLCNWRIAAARRKILEIWQLKIKQPKHVVLTRRNHTGVLTRSLFRHTMRSFGKLRRQKEFSDMHGGCVSMEVTNEGRGWHVHLHVFCDARFVDARKLAVKWGKLMKQDFAIVKVIDCREKSYLAEVTKYVVKGSELVKWHAEEISQFIHAIRGVRFFATFGTLFKLRREVQAQIDFMKPDAKPCECGCTNFFYSNEESEVIHACERKRR